MSTTDEREWYKVAREGAVNKRRQLYKEIRGLPEPHRSNLEHTYYKLFEFLEDDLKVRK